MRVETCHVMHKNCAFMGFSPVKITSLTMLKIFVNDGMMLSVMILVADVMILAHSIFKLGNDVMIFADEVTIFVEDVIW